jgi:hypothetical protein
MDIEFPAEGIQKKRSGAREHTPIIDDPVGAR